jgi:hypothetical protein
VTAQVSEAGDEIASPLESIPVGPPGPRTDT